MQFHSLPVLFSALVFALVSLTTAAATFEAGTPLSTLAIEPVSTLSTDDDATPTPIPTPTPVATNATRNIGLDNIFRLNECSAGLRNLKWSDIAYACERDEGSRDKTLVMIRRDNSYLKECGCRQGLGRYYDHFLHSEWMIMFSHYSKYWCNVRKGDYHYNSWFVTGKVITPIECRIKHCNTKNGGCTYY